MKNRETVAKVNLLSSKTNNKNTQPIILIFNAACSATQKKNVFTHTLDVKNAISPCLCFC